MKILRTRTFGLVPTIGKPPISTPTIKPNFNGVGKQLPLQPPMPKPNFNRVGTALPLNTIH